MRQPSRLAVAMHEAGHAVIWLTQQNTTPIASISLSHDMDGDLGKVDVVANWRPHMLLAPSAYAEVIERWVERARSDISFFLGGPIAEMRWRRYSRAALWIGATQMADRCVGFPQPTFGSDLYQIRQRLEWTDSGNERQAFVRAWLETEEAVAKHSHIIERLGRLLFAQNYLDENDIERFWSEHAHECRTPRL